MLPLKNRLKKEKDFQCVFNKGRVINSDLMSIRVLTNGMENTRVGFIVSKKVSKKAVLRNKIKRIFREVMRGNIGKMKGGFDVIVTAKGKIFEAQSEEIDETMKRLLEKSNLFK